jgi:serine/threonine-protein kinase HipA
LLEREEAQKMAFDIQEQVEKTWRKTGLSRGVSTRDAETIRGAFVYAGFSRNERSDYQRTTMNFQKK